MSTRPPVTDTVSMLGLPAGTRAALLCGSRARGVQWLDAIARQRADSRVVRVYRTNGAERIVYANGSTLHLMPCRPGSWRGEGFDVVLAPEGVPGPMVAAVELSTLTSPLRGEWPPERQAAHSRARAVGNAIGGGIVLALLASPLLAYLAGWLG